MRKKRKKNTLSTVLILLHVTWYEVLQQKLTATIKKQTRVMLHRVHRAAEPRGLDVNYPNSLSFTMKLLKSMKFIYVKFYFFNLKTNESLSV